MKKLLLILLLSFGFIGSANAESKIPLPSEQAVREYIYLSLFSNTKLLSNQEIIKLEAEWDEAKAKEEILTEQYRITTDEEEKFAVGKKAFEQRTEMKLIEALLSLNKHAEYADVSISPADYGLFKNHRIFQVVIQTGGLEWMMLPSMSSSGFFYTDGKSINYLHGDSRVSSLERLLNNEKLQFDTVDPQALAWFVSDVLFMHGNSGALLIRDMSDIFEGGYVIRRNENSINEDCQSTSSNYTKDEFNSLSLEEKLLQFMGINEKEIWSDECFGFTDQELTTLSHDQLIEIAKKRGFDSLLGIVLPSLKKEGDNWILEFTTTYGWMHERQLLRLHNITFSPEYKVSLKESVLSRDLYMGIPEIVY